MRWLKMSKFLPELGWQPIIYTPENPDPSISDITLLKEIHDEIIELKTPIWEPYDIYRKLTGKKRNDKFKAGYISEASSGNWKSRISSKRTLLSCCLRWAQPWQRIPIVR